MGRDPAGNRILCLGDHSRITAKPEVDSLDEFASLKAFVISHASRPRTAGLEIRVLCGSIAVGGLARKTYLPRHLRERSNVNFVLVNSRLLVTNPGRCSNLGSDDL